MNGILVVDKPPGMTSHDVVQRVRRLTGERSIGHLGTLDPMATGVLPLLLGRFTRLAQFFGDAGKEYEGTIRFGQSTDTYDADGDPVDSEKPVTFSEEELASAVSELTGEIEQIPPAFSAKKTAGVPAYKLARKGEMPTLQPMRVRVYEFSVVRATEASGDGHDFNILHNTHYRTLYQFNVSVSAGTYVRSLAHDLGQKLGCGAHLASLRRTRSGEFGLDRAVQLAVLDQMTTDEIADAMIDPRAVLPHMPNVILRSEETERIRHGNASNLPIFGTGDLAKVFDGTELIAIAKRVAGTLFQPKVVLV